MLAGFVTTPILALTSSIPQIINTTGSLKRLMDLSHTASAREFENDDTLSQTPPQDGDFLGSEVIVRDLSFKHLGQDDPAISRINMNIKQGEQIAITGHENSGKSTLAKLLSGLLDPGSGTILFDGRSRLEYNRNHFRRAVTLLDHEQHFFDGSVSENLTMWHRYLDDDHIRKIAEITGLHEMLLKRPESYQQSIKQVGHGFSYGEFELLSLTRAILLQPKILILDGLKYAINNHNIEKIFSYLRSSNVSLIVVSNDEGIVKKFERIIHLKEGSIDFDGSQKKHQQWIEKMDTENESEDKAA